MARNVLNMAAFFGALTLARGREDLSIFPQLPVGVPKSENSVCREHSELFVDSLRNHSLWAHEMWDATAKSTAGLLRGSVFHMGDFEQCITAKAPFPTKYCLATITAEVPKPPDERDIVSLHFNPQASVLQRLYKYPDKTQQSRNVVNIGWCVPSSCTNMDLDKSLNDYLNRIEIHMKDTNITYTAQFNSDFCHVAADSQYLDKADISFMLLTAILIILVVVATTFDYNTSDKEDSKKPTKRSLTSRLILSFSARINWHDLPKKDDSNPALSILYGMRTFAIFVIILDHRFGTFTSSALLNFDYVEEQYRSPLACLLFHGDVLVDSFFILSGLLVTYGLLVQFDKRIMNPAFVVLLRYIRLTPVYAFVIFYYATIFNHTGNGPLWKVIAGGDWKDCRSNWWVNLLYLNNYVYPDNACMTHTWYLPCDFHYFIIAIGVCMLIKKEKKIGLSALLSLTIVSMVIPFVLTVIYRRPAMLQFYPDFLTGPKVHPDFQLTYSKSHTRATPYFIGMFAGYRYYKLKGKDYHVCRAKTFMITIISLGFLVAAIFGGAVFYDPYHPYNPIESGIYSALHRPAWAIGSVGLLYVASFGHASFLQKVLTWSPWIPLSKLVYGAYLTHMTFQLRSAAKFENPRQISYFDLISLSLSDSVLAFASALCLYLMIEAPFRKIFRELLMPSRPQPTKPTMESVTGRDNAAMNNNEEDSRL